MKGMKRLENTIPVLIPVTRWYGIRMCFISLSVFSSLFVSVLADIVYVHPIPKFLCNTTLGVSVLVFVIVFIPIILSVTLCVCKKSLMWYLACVLLYVSIHCSFGLICALVPDLGKVVIEAGILVTVAFLSIVIYSFWAAVRGLEFSFLGPHLSTSVSEFIAFVLIQKLTPIGPPPLMVFSLFGALSCSNAYIRLACDVVKEYKFIEDIRAQVSSGSGKVEALGLLEAGDASA